MLVGASSLGRESGPGCPARGTYTGVVMSVAPGRLMGALMVAVLVAGCGLLPTGQTPGTVTLYGRAAPEGDSWFGLVTADDPPQVVGFGSDGVGCLDGRPGTQVAWFDGAPGDGGVPRQIIGVLPADGSPLVLSVEVAADGSLLVGRGVPAWWEGDPQVC